MDYNCVKCFRKRKKNPPWVGSLIDITRDLVIVD